MNEEIGEEKSATIYVVFCFALFFGHILRVMITK